MTMPSHLILPGPVPPEGLGLPPLLTGPIDADERRHGPYTMAAALLAAVVPVALERWPELVAEHDIEIRAMAPDLCERVPARRESIGARLPRSDRILVPAPQRSLRIAGGAADFLIEHLRRLEAGPVTLHVRNSGLAGAPDREFLDVLRRRLDPALLCVAQSEADADRRQPPEFAPASWPPEWHDARAAELAAGDPVGPKLGALLYHREHGTPSLEAARDFQYALTWCLDIGCHEPVPELGRRGLEYADPKADPDTWWELIHGTAIALVALERESEAEEYLHEARAATVSPVWHSTIHYTIAMLLTRHHNPDRRDLDAALGWINTAITICDLLPDPANRATKLGFDLNGKALILARKGDLEGAMEHVQSAIDLADRDLAPGAQPIHRLVLRANRAQLRIAAGDHEAALDDLDAAIAADPGYPDYYLDRGNLLSTMGRPAEAIADYETALRVGLPFPEAHHNRAELRFAAGDLDGALDDLTRALELDPEFLDARINRAGLLAALERHDEALADVRNGLARDKTNPYLLTVLGQLELERDRPGAALTAFNAAIDGDASLAQAWAGHGTAAHRAGDAQRAIDDLTTALLLTKDPAEQAALLFNRAVAHRTAANTAAATADLARARELAPDDEDIRRALEG